MKSYLSSSWILVSLLAVVALLLTVQACTEGQSRSQQSADVPVLLDRNPGIGSAEEQQHCTQTFTTLTNRLWKDPSDPEVRLKLAQLYMLEARATGEHGYYYPAALKMLDFVLHQHPAKEHHFHALMLKASVQLSLHQFRNALATAEKAVAINPNNAQIYGALVDAHVELGNYEKAVEIADKMVSIRPDLRSYSRVSYLREIHGEVDGAIKAMEMAISAGFPGYEDMAWCRLTLGDLHKTYGDLEKAEFQYRSALAERSGYPFATAALAELEMENGNYEAAEKLLKDACELIPEVGFYERLAKLYLKTGREEEAHKLRNEVLEMLADDESHGHKMGMEYAVVYRDLFLDYEKALEYARREYEQRPENIEVNRLMASIYAKMDNRESARFHLDKASKTDSKAPELLELMVWVDA